MSEMAPQMAPASYMKLGALLSEARSTMVVGVVANRHVFYMTVCIVSIITQPRRMMDRCFMCPTNLQLKRTREVRLLQGLQENLGCTRERR